MKIRSGFVSNSSSSSFIIVTTKKDHEKALKSLTPDEVEFLNSAATFKKVGTQELALFSWEETNECISAADWDGCKSSFGYIDYHEESINDENSEIDEIYERYSGIFSRYQKLLPKSAATSSQGR